MSYGDIRDRLLELPHPPPEGGTAYALLDLFTVRHRLIRELDPPPRSVFEFGALLGFFLVTALDGAPAIRRVGWVDDESHTAGSNEGCLANVRFCLSACGVVRCFTSRADAVGRYDLVQVDSDHSFEGCLADLQAAARLKPRWIMLDDWAATGHSDGIQRAARTWLATQPAGRWELTEHTTVNGLALLTKLTPS